LSSIKCSYSDQMGHIPEDQAATQYTYYKCS
jgi:hypothetical protein